MSLVFEDFDNSPIHAGYVGQVAVSTARSVKTVCLFNDGIPFVGGDIRLEATHGSDSLTFTKLQALAPVLLTADSVGTLRVPSSIPSWAHPWAAAELDMTFVPKLWIEAHSLADSTRVVRAAVANITTVLQDQAGALAALSYAVGSGWLPGDGGLPSGCFVEYRVEWQIQEMGAPLNTQRFIVPLVWDGAEYHGVDAFTVGVAPVPVAKLLTNSGAAATTLAVSMGAGERKYFDVPVTIPASPTPTGMQRFFVVSAYDATARVTTDDMRFAVGVDFPAALSYAVVKAVETPMQTNAFSRFPAVYSNAAGTKVTCIGGYDNVTLAMMSHNKEYDVASKTWAVKTSMPGGVRCYFGAARVGSLIYIGGAYGPGWGLINSFHSYDPVADVYAALPLPPTHTITAAAYAVDELVVFTGGGFTPTKVQVYNTLTGTWTSFVVPYDMREYPGWVYNGKVQIISHASAPGGGKQVLSINPRTGAYTLLAPMTLATYPAYTMNALPLSDHEFLLPFVNGASLKYDAAADVWSSMPGVGDRSYCGVAVKTVGDLPEGFSFGDLGNGATSKETWHIQKFSYLASLYSADSIVAWNNKVVDPAAVTQVAQFRFDTGSIVVVPVRKYPPGVDYFVDAEYLALQTGVALPKFSLALDGYPNSLSSEFRFALVACKSITIYTVNGVSPTLYVATWEPVKAYDVRIEAAGLNWAVAEFMELLTPEDSLGFKRSGIVLPSLEGDKMFKGRIQFVNGVPAAGSTRTIVVRGSFK